MSFELQYQTVDIERRGYGRRYTGLPVDRLSRSEFMIDFTGAYTKPEMIDIQHDDIVRWREGERLIQGRVATVHRDELSLHVVIEDVLPLPPEAFFP
jgi:hypothetical protein